MGSVYPSCLSRNRTITNARGMTTQRRAQTEQPPSEQIEHTPSEQPPSEQPPSEQHINKTGFSRMRVGLAVDVVSIDSDCATAKQLRFHRLLSLLPAGRTDGSGCARAGLGNVRQNLVQ